MTLPPKDSPIWPLLRVALRSTVVLACLWAFYERLDPRDVKTMLAFLLSDLGLSGIGQMARGKE